MFYETEGKIFQLKEKKRAIWVVTLHDHLHRVLVDPRLAHQRDLLPASWVK
jgi:hypothetical protein